jgi:uncharacterized SAM-binding protein YcdF (DUF218 family)
LLFGCTVGIAVFFASYPFLAVTDRKETEILVVEGWIDHYAIHAAVSEFKAHPAYRRVFCTGGPVSGSGGYTNDFNTSASVGAERLIGFGLAPSVVQMVPSREMDRDRTYSAALALRRWMQQNDLHPAAINVLTQALHSRRSRLLFEKAFRGTGTQVGVVPVDSPDFPPQRWWRYSEGVKEMISEAAAYVYARIFFFPAAEGEENARGEKLKR